LVKPQISAVTGWKTIGFLTAGKMRAKATI
jgi:hypothetical protein